MCNGFDREGGQLHRTAWTHVISIVFKEFAITTQKRYHYRVDVSKMARYSVEGLALKWRIKGTLDL